MQVTCGISLSSCQLPTRKPHIPKLHAPNTTGSIPPGRLASLRYQLTVLGLGAEHVPVGAIGWAPCLCEHVP